MPAMTREQKVDYYIGQRLINRESDLPNEKKMATADYVVYLMEQASALTDEQLDWAVTEATDGPYMIWHCPAYFIAEESMMLPIEDEKGEIRFETRQQAEQAIAAHKKKYSSAKKMAKWIEDSISEMVDFFRGS